MKARQGQDQRLARGLGLRQPSPTRGTPKTMASQLKAIINGPRPEAHGVVFAITAKSTLGSSMTCNPTAAAMEGSNNHCLPARVMSNQVAPGRERRPISAKNIHCLGGGNFGRTAPSQIRLVFTLVVQVHDR